jgi:hypothetical protein
VFFSAIPVDLFLNFKSAKKTWNKQLLYLYLGLSRERYHCAMAELQPAALFDLLPNIAKLLIVDGLASARNHAVVAWISAHRCFPWGILETISMAVCTSF